MSFRPFTVGDILLLQRLRRYATPLQIERTLLEPVSPLRSALQSCLPWHRTGFYTYILRQEEYQPVREGLLQLRLRANSQEADVTLLAPALDAPQGHPAIWQKLLTHGTQHIARAKVGRVFSDLPDQPLLVNTFKQAGFSLYTRTTVWRLVTDSLAWVSDPAGAGIRAQEEADGWALDRLYAAITPKPVCQLEIPPSGNDLGDNGRKSPICTNPYHTPMSGFVLEDRGGRGIQGCVQILWGRQCAWIRLWVDANDPKMEQAGLLLRFALQRILEDADTRRTYIAVREYQTGLNSLLTDYGFAPFSDRALMVRNIMQWVQERAAKRLPGLESVREAVPGSLVSPKRGVEGAEPAAIAPKEH